MNMSYIYEIKTTALSRYNAPAHQISASIIGLTFGAIGALISITAILFGATHGGGVALYALLSLYFTGIGILLGILRVRLFILHSAHARIGLFCFISSHVFLPDSLHILSYSPDESGISGALSHIDQALQAQVISIFRNAHCPICARPAKDVHGVEEKAAWQIEVWR